MPKVTDNSAGKGRKPRTKTAPPAAAATDNSNLLKLMDQARNMMEAMERERKELEEATESLKRSTKELEQMAAAAPPSPCINCKMRGNCRFSVQTGRPTFCLYMPAAPAPAPAEEYSPSYSYCRVSSSGEPLALPEPLTAWQGRLTRHLEAHVN